MKLPAPETITPTTPLRLEVAAELGFPDGSMSAGALRRLAASGKLAHEKIAGKYFITLAAIEEMRASCRVRAKAPDLPSKDQKTDSQSGSSETDSAPSALDAMNALAEELIESLQTKPTTRPKLRRRF
ncbi:hypothetical protein GGQ85_001662 [Nitrobacter vulgaris]|uniref:helix-turn-helix domain-containing protein n=1 Tax=Nitrobacter vulgaris TaxID=29421 RepID=UPI00285FB263|nr:helix-turn-helix domain-containing protein [Nitrobacter vulgaris]MDR6303963.1 hypothetical protein [Nitrobacter vulgaris]